MSGQAIIAVLLPRIKCREAYCDIDIDASVRCRISKITHPPLNVHTSPRVILYEAKQYDLHYIFILQIYNIIDYQVMTD